MYSPETDSENAAK